MKNNVTIYVLIFLIGGRMLEGIIISNISNTYTVETENKDYECTARGKFKNSDIIPVVGDKVKIDIVDEEKV